jgi:hypothetical protein
LDILIDALDQSLSGRNETISDPAQHGARR